MLFVQVYLVDLGKSPHIDSQMFNTGIRYPCFGRFQKSEQIFTVVLK